MNPGQAKHLYIHIPFCHRRCSYCDFNTYANMEDRMVAYVAALCQEIRSLPQWWGGVAEPAFDPQTSPALLTRSALRPTIFLGGGTPSILPLPLMEQVLAAADSVVPLRGAEVTVEANPGTVLGRGYLRSLRSLGVNRLSMGVQSLHDPTLRMLGRIHTAAEAYTSFADARAAGFDNLNLDFIFGLPGQTLEHWRAAVDAIVAWGADHFSLYSLILEESTPLFAQVQGGRLSVPDDDLTGAMYETAMERLAVAGYAQYEISNWALPLARQETRDRRQETRDKRQETRDKRQEPRGPEAAHIAGRVSPASLKACHHNLAYWLNADYLAAGAGAHGHAYPQRYADVLAIDSYIAAVATGEPPAAEVTELTAQDLAAETMFMGLRLNVGVSAAHFRQRTGHELETVFGPVLAELVELGLLEWDGQTARLTQRGRMLGNRVFERFV